MSAGSEEARTLASAGSLSEKNQIHGREDFGSVHHFTGGTSRTHVQRWEGFWIGFALSVMGFLTQSAAYLWMLAGGVG